MEIKKLEKYGVEDMANCLDEAFSDYFQPVNIPVDKFDYLNKIRGVRYDLSFGAEDEGKLVGLVINAVREWEGQMTAYDCGTGIIPSHRSQGIGKTLIEKGMEFIKEEGVTQYLLEVIQANTKAFNLYKNKGFEITREFDLVATENPYHSKSHDEKSENSELPVIDKKLSPRIPPLKSLDDIKIKFEEENLTKSNLSYDSLSKLWDYGPSWQCSLDTILEMSEYCSIIFAVSEDNKKVGYILYNKMSGEIYQLAVEKNMRRQNIGQNLLDHARFNTKKRPHNYMMNIDTRMESMLNLLSKNGFNSFEKQYEMILKL